MNWRRRHNSLPTATPPPPSTVHFAKEAAQRTGHMTHFPAACISRPTDLFLSLLFFVFFEELISYYVNLCDVTSKICPAAMFVIVDTNNTSYIIRRYVYGPTPCQIPLVYTVSETSLNVTSSSDSDSEHFIIIRK
jgi:hypothetical protein